MPSQNALLVTADANTVPQPHEGNTGPAALGAVTVNTPQNAFSFQNSYLSRLPLELLIYVLKHLYPIHLVMFCDAYTSGRELLLFNNMQDIWQSSRVNCGVSDGNKIVPMPPPPPGTTELEHARQSFQPRCQDCGESCISTWGDEVALCDPCISRSPLYTRLKLDRSQSIKAPLGFISGTYRLGAVYVKTTVHQAFIRLLHALGAPRLQDNWNAVLPKLNEFAEHHEASIMEKKNLHMWVDSFRAREPQMDRPLAAPLERLSQVIPEMIPLPNFDVFKLYRLLPDDREGLLRLVQTFAAERSYQDFRRAACDAIINYIGDCAAERDKRLLRLERIFRFQVLPVLDKLVKTLLREDPHQFLPPLLDLVSYKPFESRINQCLTQIKEELESLTPYTALEADLSEILQGCMHVLREERRDKLFAKLDVGPPNGGLARDMQLSLASVWLKCITCGARLDAQQAECHSCPIAEKYAKTQRFFVITQTPLQELWNKAVEFSADGNVLPTSNVLEHIEPDAFASAAARHLVHLCQLDPNSATAGAMDQLNPRLLCEPCGKVMRWRTAVRHAAAPGVCRATEAAPFAGWKLVRGEEREAVLRAEQPAVDAFTAERMCCEWCRSWQANLKRAVMDLKNLQHHLYTVHDAWVIDLFAAQDFSFARSDRSRLAIVKPMALPWPQ